MTQETMPQSQPQCSTADELWAAYDGHNKEVEELRNHWYELSAEYDRLSNLAGEAFQRTHEAWDNYQAAQQQRDAAYQAVVEAERNQIEQPSEQLTV